MKGKRRSQGGGKRSKLIRGRSANEATGINCEEGLRIGKSPLVPSGENGRLEEKEKGRKSLWVLARPGGSGSNKVNEGDRQEGREAH